jgi:flagellar hook-associated protein 3 FlgL
MSTVISTMGLELLNVNNLTEGQGKLSLLSQQLASGIRSKDLTDYASSEAKFLMNFNNAITTRESFLKVANTIGSRLDIYDLSLTQIEKTAAQATTAIISSSTYNSTQNEALASQIQGCLDQVSYYLNQKTGDRYLFAGSRYNTSPVSDLNALPVPPTETAPYTTTGSALPAYDVDYDSLDPNKPVPEAYVEDQVSIDSTQKLTYGVVSTADGFQKLIMGLRWAYAATQDPANYQAYMTTASGLVSGGLEDIRGLHTGVSNANSALNQTKNLHTSFIEDLQGQIDDIQNVDVTEVAVKINTYQAQLEASYAATARMTSLSILKYL